MIALVIIDVLVKILGARIRQACRDCPRAPPGLDPQADTDSQLPAYADEDPHAKGAWTRASRPTQGVGLTGEEPRGNNRGPSNKRSADSLFHTTAPANG